MVEKKNNYNEEPEHRSLPEEEVSVFNTLQSKINYSSPSGSTSYLWTFALDFSITIVSFIPPYLSTLFMLPLAYDNKGQITRRFVVVL